MLNEEISLSAYLKDLYLNDLQDLNNDGLVTVSNDEEHILLQYVMIKYVISNDSQDIDKYKNFISIWTKAVIRDNDISDGSIRKIETKAKDYNEIQTNVKKDNSLKSNNKIKTTSEEKDLKQITEETNKKIRTSKRIETVIKGAKFINNSTQKKT